MRNAETARQPRASADRTHRSFSLQDATESAAAQAWVPINYWQVSPGAFSGHIQCVALPGLELFHEYYDQDVCKAGALPPGQCTVSFVSRGHGSTRFSQFVADGDVQSFFQPEGHAFDILVPAGVRTAYVHLAAAELIGELTRLNAPLAERFAAGDSLQSLGMTGKAQLKRCMQAILAFSAREGVGPGGANPKALGEILREQLVLALSASGEPHCGSSAQLHKRRRAWVIARRAREFVEEQVRLGITPRLADVCAYSGVCERTLRWAFLDQFGHPPTAFIRLMRMNAVRADLLRPAADTTVTDIATRWGFLQLGRFARDYHRLFGESPSVTLGRVHRGR